MPEPDDKPKHSPHDAFVFQQFSQVDRVLPLLQGVLSPTLIGKVRWPSMTLAQSRFVDPQLRSHFSDLVYRAEWKGDGEPLFFYLLFEHKSWPDALAPLQLLVGTVSIWQEFVRDRVADGQRLRLPFVYPLALYHGEKGWTISRQFADMVWVPGELRGELEGQIPRFEYALVDLQKMKMEEIRGTAQVRMILALLKAVSEGRETEWFEKIFTPLMPVLAQTEAAGFLKELLTYLWRASGRVEPSTFKQMVDRIPDEQTRTDIMTLAEKFYEEGKQEGWKEGKQEGWQEGKQEGWQEGQQEGWRKGQSDGWRKGQSEGQVEGQQKAVLSVLEARFGIVPLEARQKIRAMSSEAELAGALRLAVTSTSFIEFVARMS